jgi:hypothetical protein
MLNSIRENQHPWYRLFAKREWLKTHLDLSRKQGEVVYQSTQWEERIVQEAMTGAMARAQRCIPDTHWDRIEILVNPPAFGLCGTVAWKYFPKKHTLIHTGGEQPCGGIAFYYYGPLEGEILAGKAELLDGTVPALSTRIICGTCKFPFTKKTDGGYIIGVTPLE